MRQRWETWVTRLRVEVVTTRTDIALLFPGQGSQTPDMRDDVARELPDLLDRCIELVGEDPFPRAGESTRLELALQPTPAITMEAFTVSTEREGHALAVTEQRTRLR